VDLLLSCLLIVCPVHALHPCLVWRWRQATAANKKKAARTAWSIGMNKAMAQVCV
jgi:hypothetical protein